MGCYLEFSPIYSFLICFMWPITLNVYPATFETHLTTNIMLCACIRDVLYFVFFRFHFLHLSFLFILLLSVPSSSALSFLSPSLFFLLYLANLFIYLFIYLFLFSLIYLFKLSYYMISCFISSTNHTAGAHDPCYFTFFSFHFSLIFLRYLFPSTFSFLFLILSF